MATAHVLWPQHMCCGHNTCAVATVHVLWPQHMCRGHSTCAVVKTHVLWSTHMCPGQNICALARAHVIWPKHMCSGHSTCALARAHVPWQEHMCPGQNTCALARTHVLWPEHMYSGQSTCALATILAKTLACYPEGPDDFVFFRKSSGSLFASLWLASSSTALLFSGLLVSLFLYISLCYSSAREDSSGASLKAWSKYTVCSLNAQ